MSSNINLQGITKHSMRRLTRADSCGWGFETKNVVSCISAAAAGSFFLFLSTKPTVMSEKNKPSPPVPPYQYPPPPTQKQEGYYPGPPPPVTAQQQQPVSNSSSSGYPGVVGGTPSCQEGVEGYDAYGQPVRPAFMEERVRIQQSLGPSCPRRGYHELRMHYTNTSLFFAILIFPYLCGWRGKREASIFLFSYYMYIYIYIQDELRTLFFSFLFSVYASIADKSFPTLFYQNRNMHSCLLTRCPYFLHRQTVQPHGDDDENDDTGCHGHECETMGGRW